MKQGPHSRAWAHLPGLDCWTDWELAHRVAIRIEWEWQGQKKTTYCYRSGAENKLQIRAPGQILPHVVAAGLWRHLMRYRKASYLSFDRGERATAHILDMHVDHLRQQVTIKERLASMNDVLRPSQRRDHSVLVEQMRGLGLHSVDMKTGAERYAPCDLCRASEFNESLSKGQLERCLRRRVRCEYCQSMGLPCSYTRDIPNTIAVQFALLMVPPDHTVWNVQQRQWTLAKY